jgi:acyl dehydratase
MATVTTMNLADFEGRVYGPVPWRVAVESVRDFIDLTGDDIDRWAGHAPPGFAAAALFAVAPDLLAELYDRSVVHGEQTFEWARPIDVGALLDVSGTVSRVRERGGVHFVTFEMTASGDDGPVVGGKSLFLVSGESLAAGEAGFERPEPPHSYRGEMAPGTVAASRSDLIRYASATRDWNPVHWDHEAALAAGFPGVVVHGLLQAGWALRAATPGPASVRPFRSARFRFRSPLLPARPVTVTADDGAGAIEVTLSDDDTEYLTATVSLWDE